MDLVCIRPRDDLRYALELDLRYRVLREPLGMGRHQVGFAGEEDALHVLAMEGASVTGCVLFDWSSGRLRAMAVDPRHQRRGLGVELVSRLEREVLSRGVLRVTLHARQSAVPFYERLGYVVEGEPFTEVGLAHRTMIKVL
jgi:GNAT superfamily N-acetyltransferase